MSVTAKDVKSFTAGKLYKLLNASNEHRQKAVLANLRRGIGKTPGEIPELWGEFLADMPEEMFGKGKPSVTEWAVYTVLTLFALHQQGHDPKMEPMHREGQEIGRATRLLVENENDEERIRKKFNIVATSTDIRELANHLRALVSLLRTKGISMDYAALAADLYQYQNPNYRSNVRLKWGQDFYGLTERKDEKNDK